VASVTETVFMSAPLASMIVTAQWRKSCTGGRPDFFTSHWK
jgi:hypothetical protein